MRAYYHPRAILSALNVFLSKLVSFKLALEEKASLRETNGEERVSLVAKAD